MSSSEQPESPSSGILVHVFGRTDVGRTREHNEDAFVVADLTTLNCSLQPEVRTHRPGPRGSLFMVADGMGGAAAGEIASSMAVDIVLAELRDRWTEAPGADPSSFAAALKAATETANDRIFRYAAEHPEYRGMGTTATIAGLLGDTLYLCQVGDSRAYLVRDGEARQITKDQSLMQKLIEANELTEEEAERSERRNIILQALGPEAAIRVDLTHQRVRRGDTLVLCSDGLSGQVRKDEIAQVVATDPDPMSVCKQLIDRANAAGGPDNITVIAARFEGDGLDMAGAGDRVGHATYALGENTPTQPVPRWAPRSDSPTVPIPAAVPDEIRAAADEPTLELERDPALRRASIPAAVRGVVPPERRARGQAWMTALVVLAVVAAAAFAWRHFFPG